MKSFIRSGPVQTLLAYLIWGYMVLLSHANRWTVEGLDKVGPLWDGEEGLVVATWHSRILLLPVGWTRYMRHRVGSDGKLAILISLSKDGEFVASRNLKTGVSADKDVRDVLIVKDKNKSMLLIANNNDKLQIYSY